ncbi:TPA: hypothetical protein EYP70_06435 [Candidatus Bathyarchaeota archaeon]|nr:hypothetical protein [Candidatus Bathyarchaeota archaeon]
MLLPLIFSSLILPLINLLIIEYIKFDAEGHFYREGMGLDLNVSGLIGINSIVGRSVVIGYPELDVMLIILSLNAFCLIITTHEFTKARLNRKNQKKYKRYANGAFLSGLTIFIIDYLISLYLLLSQK